MSENSDFASIKGLAAPAQRALAGAGFTKLEHLVAVTEEELHQLHGMGPNALKVLQKALAEQGLSFKK